MTKNIKNINFINKQKLMTSYKKCMNEIEEIQRIYKIYVKDDEKLSEVGKYINEAIEKILKTICESDY